MHCYSSHTNQYLDPGSLGRLDYKEHTRKWIPERNSNYKSMYSF